MDGLLYQPFYCEENVYQLCGAPRFAGLERRVVFVSNDRRAVALRHQRSAPSPGALVVWDYHVVFCVRDETWEVWDLDTTLGIPVRASEYLRETFEGLPDVGALSPRFRVIAADEFALRFCSDRSHMRRADGGYTQAPPPWPPIVPHGEAVNLARFIDTRRPFCGDRTDLAGLRALLGIS